MIDVIKEYLVSLGMQVDRNSFDTADQAVQTLENGIKRFAGSAIKQFALAGASIVGSLATANVGIVTFLGSLAKADLENEKFATRMWISKEAAAELNNTLKAMNATIEDLYLSPELLRNFNELRASIKDMKPPPEYQNQMKFIRSIQFEFQRLRLEGMYALQWIGYYLFKYLEGPIRDLKKNFKEFNDSITKSMPTWTRDIAQVLSWFVRLGSTAVQAGKDVWRMFDILSDKIPTSAKIIGAALLGLAIALNSPFLGFSFIIGGILLLLDDFYTYLRGGESALGPLWEILTDFYKTLKDTGIIDGFGEAFEKALRTVEGWLKKAWGWLGKLFNKAKERGYLDALERAWSSTFGLLFTIISGLWGWVTKFFDDLNKEGILSGLIDSLVGLGTEVLSIIGWVSDLVTEFLEMEEVQAVLEGIGDFISGTLKFALEGISRVLDRITNSMKIARAWLAGDDEALDKALKEQEEIDRKEQEFSDYYGGKMQDFFRFMFADSNANPFAKGIEPALKKAMNDSEIAKGFRSYNQDLKNGLNLLAASINPEVFDRYQSLATGSYLSSYMYATNSNQTIIRNENKPVFNISSTDPKAAAQEVSLTWNAWSAMNIRNIRPVNG